MAYRLIRSRRKTLAIHITQDAVVEVRAPLRLPQYRIEEFLQQKDAWIRTHLNEVLETKEERAAFTPEPALTLLGRDYPVVRIPEAEPATFDGVRFLLPRGAWPEVRPAVMTLYAELAAADFSARVRHWCAVMGVAPTSLKITGAAKRWGSCSGKNGICFSWRLVLAPPDAVDYVVVHELAHILQHNHSDAFWGAVGRVLPDYKRRQRLLSATQQHPSTQDW